MEITVVVAAFPRTGPEQMTHWFKLATVSLSPALCAVFLGASTFPTDPTFAVTFQRNLLLSSMTNGLGNGDVSCKLVLWNVCMLQTGTTIHILGQGEELCAVEAKEDSDVEP